MQCSICGNKDDDPYDVICLKCYDSTKTETQRLRKLVKAAYLEGHRIGVGEGNYGSDIRCWKNSQAKAALEEANNKNAKLQKSDFRQR